MKLWALPKIEYPATHRFESKLFTRVAYAGAFVTVVIFTILNVAVVGYEPDVVKSSDFNETRTFWFHKFAPPPEPGTLCDRRVFNVGESLVTNASIFEWKIVAITRPNAGKYGVEYGGSSLDNCDVVQINFNGDIRTWTVEVTAYAACRGHANLEVIAATSMSFSALPARRGPLLRNIQYSTTDPISVDLTNMFSMATEDVVLRTWDAFLESNRTGTVAVSLSANTELCAPLIGLRDNTPSPCASQPPRLNLTATCTIEANLDLKQDSSFVAPLGAPYELDETLRPPIANLLHLALAAMRVDLGNRSPNNLLTHPEVLDKTLTEVFPGTPSAPSRPSTLYTHLRQQSLLVGSESGSVFDPFRIPGPSVVQAVYVCKFLKRKSAGNLMVSVISATASFFASGWGIFIAVASWLKEARVSEGASQDATAAPTAESGSTKDSAALDGEGGDGLGGGATLSPVSTSASGVTYTNIG